MVEILPYTYKMYADAVALHDAHQSPIPPSDSLPAIGFAAIKEQKVVAMGFLRMVEGGIGQIDTLVSNPAFDSHCRNWALEDVISALISKAKDLKLKGILSYTADKSVLMRAEALGFRILPQTVIALPIEATNE